MLMMSKGSRSKWKKVEIEQISRINDQLLSKPAGFAGYSVEKWRQPGLPNPAMQRYILASEGCMVFQWSDPPGSIYPAHKHDTDQTHWVVSGSLELDIERFGTFVLNAGDRDFLPAGTYHTARVVGNEPVVYLVGEYVRT